MARSGVIVRRLAAPAAVDVDAAERTAGVTLSGATEAGLSVSIATGTGSNVTVTADEAGAWSATVPSANLPSLQPSQAT
jgi:hypothetical protein